MIAIKGVNDDEIMRRFIEFKKRYLDAYREFDRNLADYIEDNFFTFVYSPAAPDVLMQVYELCGIESQDGTFYNAHLDRLKDIYGLDKNIVEVASGVIPSFAKKIYKEQMRLGKGTITIYEPDLLFEREESCPKMVINRKNFNSTCNIKDSDLIAGLFPCEATEPIIEEACKYDKDFYVAMCGCVHFRNANIPYSESNSRLYQSYVIDLADRLVSSNKELVVDMLDDKYMVPYPIIYTKKK